MRVLIIKIGAVGDAVMALSMLVPILRKDPDARITWVCGRAIEPLLLATGKVREVVAVDEGKLLKGGLPQRLSALLGVWSKLFGRRFDLVLTGHSDRRYRSLGAVVFGRERRSFGRVQGRSWPVPGRYHGDEYVRLVTDIDGPLACKAEILPMELPMPEGLRGLLPVGGNPMVAIAPGGAKNTLRDDALRRWPLGHYRALAGLLLKAGYRVLLTGSHSDEWVRGSFEGLDVVDLIGKTDLTGLAALYRECGLVVTHDSGPHHIAVLAGAPLLVLFGPTDPREKVPENGRSRVLWGGATLACRPCYDGKNYADCLDNLCLRSVTPEMAFEESRKILSGK